MNLNRRQLLTNTAKIVATINVSSALTFPVIVNASGAAKFLSFSDEQVEILRSLSRSMFPHESLDDSYYLAVIQNIDRQANKNADLRQLLNDGTKNLDTAYGSPWLNLSDNERQQLMKKIESSPFFALVLHSSIDVLYRHPDVWKLIGYEGSSIEHGGYLHRGFDDIDWLPQ